MSWYFSTVRNLWQMKRINAVFDRGRQTITPSIKTGVKRPTTNTNLFDEMENISNICDDDTAENTKSLGKQTDQEKSEHELTLN